MYKRRHGKKYKNKNLFVRINKRCKCRGIGKEIKFVFQMQTNVRVEKMPTKITNYFRM
jgi:hypothetical protein